jgi:hypothetical protein
MLFDYIRAKQYLKRLMPLLIRKMSSADPLFGLICKAKGGYCSLDGFI